MRDWIDAVRSFARLCVIMTHAAMPNGSDGQYMVAIYNYLTIGGASILFFMISGALILNKERDTIPFMKKELLESFSQWYFGTCSLLELNIYKEYYCARSHW